MAETDDNNYDNGGTRSGDERRQYQESVRNPDRKSGRDHRKGSDRRTGLGSYEVSGAWSSRAKRSI